MNDEPVPGQTYLETLQLYYEEEIEGEAYFTAIAERLEGDAREKMQLLADVETRAAEVTAPLLQRHGLTPRPRDELHAEGRKQAASVGAEYDALIARWRREFPRYMEDFARLEAMAPERDLPALRELTRHETAAIAFLEAEAKGEADSARHLRAYLERAAP
ncbi:hypothetical protein K1T73_16105 [Roseovarius sp. SCSIO 43702]|uniref:hypothetical protein n=1 Tax=Roseovarius sp. SCSIO 43702 TaxID=2823043 RepID=UPI001C73D1B0|nr:hypothetical protein [Roseovarius sp. SCSIO 43702]QYX56546.1 hypothetical protein K1T73_16105 [Roseovarius sp. SCSIO 43702]